VPVLTGIGHERADTSVDEVAHGKFYREAYDASNGTPKPFETKTNLTSTTCWTRQRGVRAQGCRRCPEWKNLLRSRPKLGRRSVGWLRGGRRHFVQ
jgi:ribosomal protein L40E